MMSDYLAMYEEQGKYKEEYNVTNKKHLFNLVSSDTDDDDDDLDSLGEYGGEYGETWPEDPFISSFGILTFTATLDKNATLNIETSSTPLTKLEKITIKQQVSANSTALGTNHEDTRDEVKTKKTDTSEVPTTEVTTAQIPTVQALRSSLRMEEPRRRPTPQYFTFSADHLLLAEKKRLARTKQTAPR